MLSASSAQGVGAVWVCAQLAVEDDRGAEGGEAELGGHPGGGFEVEEAKGALPPLRLVFTSTVPTWLLSGQLSPERLGFEG